MGITINTNLSSLMVQNSFKNAVFDINRSIERMTTGFRINSAKDDAAGYAVASRMGVNLSSYGVVKNNTEMGVSLISTANSSLDIINNHLQRMRDLAEQAANGTYGNDSRQVIQSEIDSRTLEINRIMSGTEYNGIKLFEGNGSTGGGSGVTGSFISEVTQLTEDEAIAQGYTIIKTADELDNMRNNLSGKYILMNDIDLSGSEWTPITGVFTGKINGNGHVIKGMYINKPNGNAAFIINPDNAVISNLGFEDCNLIGEAFVGAICRWMTNTTIDNCYAAGNVTSTSPYSLGSAGLVGYMDNSTIKNSYTNVDVESACYAAGLVYNVKKGTITNCYTLGTTKGSRNTELISGLVTFVDEHLTMSNCYAAGPIIRGDSYFDPYSRGAGIIANSSAFYGGRLVINNTYFNKETTGVSVGVKGDTTQYGKTTDEINALIANGTLPQAKAQTGGGTNTDINFQIGIDSSDNSVLSINTGLKLDININVLTDSSARNALTDIDEAMNKVTSKQTLFGVMYNRLESISDSINISIENLTSSLSTIRDADISKESSAYIRAQILQQASAVLLATANQAPSFALNLI